MTELTDQIETVAGVLDTADVESDVSDDEIRSLLRAYLDKSVPASEAQWSVAKKLLRDHGVDDPSRVLNQHRRGGASGVVDIAEITDEGWVTVEAKVVRLFDSDVDQIKQKGILADETGEITFTSWESTDVPLLEEGDVYRLHNVVVDSYQDEFEIELKTTTDVTEVDRTLELTAYEGALIAIQPGSGLIKRCSEPSCSRVLREDRCAEHGTVDGEFDLRIKGLLDTGQTHITVYLDRELTETLTGVSFDEAMELARDAIDASVVADRFRDILIGEYLYVNGSRISNGLAVETGERLGNPTDEHVTNVRRELEGLSL